MAIGLDAEVVQKLGEYFGFPQCCIDDFNSRPTVLTITPEQEKVHEYHGFIPCQTHALLILRGEASLTSILANRKCEVAFPDGHVEDAMEELGLESREDEDEKSPIMGIIGEVAKMIVITAALRLPIPEVKVIITEELVKLNALTARGLLTDMRSLNDEQLDGILTKVAVIVEKAVKDSHDQDQQPEEVGLRPSVNDFGQEESL